jgi:hypothetical protein
MKYLINFLIIWSLIFSASIFGAIQNDVAQDLAVNFLDNGGIENGITGYKAYKNTAQALPVTGSGGSPSVTVAASTSSPLRGKSSLIFTKPALNVQGEGFSKSFTLDGIAKARVINIQAYYQIISGTYSGGTQTTDSDVEAYIYDVDTATVIQPTGYKLDGGISGYTYPINLTFQPANVNSTNYRLMLHVATTSALAYQLKFDGFRVDAAPRPVTNSGPQLLGTLKITGCAWGRSSSGVFPVTTGCTYVATGSLSAPSTMIPGAVLTSLNAGNVQVFMNGIVENNTGSNDTRAAYALTDGANTSMPASIGMNTSVAASSYGRNSGSLIGEFSYTSAQSNITFQPTIIGGGTVTLAAGVSFSVWYFPSSASINNDIGSSRVVAAKVNMGTSTLATTANTTINFPTVEFDTHGMYSAGTFTIPEAGFYEAKCTEFTPSATDYFVVYKNGAKIGLCGYVASATVGGGSYTDRFNSNDLITIRSNSGTSLSYVAGSYQAKVSITKILGPSQISASETVAASYWLSANLSVSAGVSINFDSKEYDTHNAVTVGAGVWKFTAPVSGLYQVGGIVYTSTAGSDFFIYKNGSIYKYADIASYTTGWRAKPNMIIRLNAGEYIDLRPAVSATMSGAALTSTTTSHISILKVGN